ARPVLTAGRRAVVRPASGLRVALAGLVVLALAGCAPGDEAAPDQDTTQSATATPSAATPAATATSSDATALDAAALSGLFERLQFPPGQYAATSDLVGSVYPGLAVSDAACLAPFGLGWED